MRGRKTCKEVKTDGSASQSKKKKVCDRCEPSKDLKGSGEMETCRRCKQGYKIRTNECGSRRMSTQEEQKRK